MVDPDDYDTQCKYCDAKPIAPGPHHATTCRRYSTTLDLNSEEANRYECKHCGVKPFVAGSHHKTNCPRYTGATSRFGSSTSAQVSQRGKNTCTGCNGTGKCRFCHGRGTELSRLVPPSMRGPFDNGFITECPMCLFGKCRWCNGTGYS